MSWNYRIVKYKNGGGYGLHEVFYDKNGLPWTMTLEPATFCCGLDEGPQGIHQSMIMARTDAIRRPIFDEPKKWPGKNPGIGHGTTILKGKSRPRQLPKD